jgi:L,D-transpeptidase YcbB
MTVTRPMFLAAAFAALPAGALAQAAAPVVVPTTAPTPAKPVAPPAVLPTVPAIPSPQLSPAQAEFLVNWLGDAASHGLARANPAVPVTSTENDHLVRTVLDRARALRTGRLDKSDFLEIWAQRPARYDPLPGFAAAVAADRLPQWASGLTPPYAGYEGLRKGLVAYRAIKADGGWAPIPAGADLAIGQKGARVAALRKRLMAEDPDTPAAGGDGFDAGLRDAVIRAQKRYGFNPTGVANAETRTALNIPVDDRIGAIMANMERWRWLPRELPKHRIQVNIAAAVLTVFEGDAPVASMRAVTGKPGGMETPMLESRIHSIVVNPPWNVPAGIAAAEYWPKEKAQPGYLAARGFKIITSPDGSRRLQQAAGPTSALGRLKFDFGNPFAVYLHDTPSRAKFTSFDRLASHGCVRLEKPLALANLMLKNDAKWGAPGAVQTTIDAGATTRVGLKEQVAVYLLYWSAFASSNGTMNFRGDPYGWDKLLAAKIETANKRAATAMIARAAPPPPALASTGTAK